MTLFDGKAAVITGGASGIGRATALLYAQEGANVVISDVDEVGGNETVQLARQAGANAIFVRADVARPENCQQLISSALEQYGRLNIAFNNAGIGGESNPVADYSSAGWEKVISINLSGVFYCMKYEIPAMLKTGTGAIVNMSSILGQVGFAKSPAYAAAKHGVVGLTQTAAIEYAQQGIRINAIGPGFISTPMIAGLEQAVIPLHPIGRLGKPEEVAELVIWLSSEKAAFITGAYYPVDGGYLAR